MYPPSPPGSNDCQSVCLGRFPFSRRIHLLAATKENRTSRHFFPRRDRTLNDETSLLAGLHRARHTTHPSRPTTTDFLRTNQPDPNTRSPPPIKEQARKSQQGNRSPPLIFYPLCTHSRPVTKPKSPQPPTPKDPVPGSRRSGPTLASWDHLIFPHAASVGNLDPRHTDGKSHRDKGPPEAGHGHPYLSLARADTRSRSQGVTYRCLLRGRLPIASCLQVLKRRPMISQPHVIQHTLVPA